MLSLPVGHAYLWHDRAGLTLIDTSVAGSAPLIGEAIEGLGYRRCDLRRLCGCCSPGDTIGRSRDGQVILGVFNVDPTQAVTSLRSPSA